MKKTIFIFDCDGTILDGFYPSQEIISKLAKKFKTPVPDKESPEFKKAWGTGGYRMIKYCFPDRNPKTVHREWKKIETKMSISLVLKTKKTLQELKRRGYISGLLTNRSWSSLKKYPEVIKNLNFKVIQTSEYKFWDWIRFKISSPRFHLPSRTHKPSSDCFNPLLKWFKKRKISPEKIYYIGDCATDFEAVYNANKKYNYNIKFMGVLTGPIRTRREWYQITGARFLTLRSVADLITWLDNKK